MSARSASVLHIRRVWSIGRVHSSKGIPEPRTGGHEAAPHFSLLSIQMAWGRPIF